MTTPAVTTVPRTLAHAHAITAQRQQKAALAEAHVTQGKPVGRYTSSDALTLRGIPVVGPLPDLADARREHKKQINRRD
jgi:hypothetical protein